MMKLIGRFLGAVCLLVIFISTVYSETQSYKVPQTTQKEVYLYFPDLNQNYLVAEKQFLQYSEHPDQFAVHILNALIRGPVNAVPCLPADTRVRAVYLSPDGIAYVDFDSDIMESYPGGINTEFLSLYSIVNSLVLNIPQIKSVKMLTKGNESLTFAGHIDVRFPIKANMLLVR